MNMVKLGGICDFFNGGAWSQNEFTEDGYPVLKVSNCKSNGFEIDSVSYIPHEIAQKSENNKLIIGDVIIATVGSHPNLIESAAGRSCVVTEEVAGFYLNQNAVCLRSNDQYILDQRYLGYLAASEPFKHYIQSRGKGAANQMRIAIGAIKEFAFNLPDIVTQRKIGSFLAAYDDLIENNQKQIKLLEEAAQRLYKEWFVDLRFPGHETTPVMEGIPEGWMQLSLEQVAPILTGKKDANFSTEDGQYPFFTCAQTPLQAPSYSFACDAVILAGNGDFNVKLYRGQFEAYQRTYVLSPENKEFLFLLYHAVNNSMAKLAQGASGSTIKFLTKGMIASIPVYVPDELTLNKFNELSEAIQKQIETLKNAVACATEARDRLLPKLMSGEIEV